MTESQKQAIVAMLKGVLVAIARGQKVATVNLASDPLAVRDSDSMGLVTDMCTRMGFTITWQPGDLCPASIAFPPSGS